jgi:hypothetical protein
LVAVVADKAQMPAQVIQKMAAQGVVVDIFLLLLEQEQAVKVLLVETPLVDNLPQAVEVLVQLVKMVVVQYPDQAVLV